jgi:hypothetical protein
MVFSGRELNAISFAAYLLRLPFVTKDAGSSPTGRKGNNS